MIERVARESCEITKEISERYGLSIQRANIIAGRILRAIKEEAEEQVERAKNADPQDFVIPRGKYAGRKLADLTDVELHNSWAGFNGSRTGAEIAKILMREKARRSAAAEPYASPAPAVVAWKASGDDSEPPFSVDPEAVDAAFRSMFH